VYCSGGSHEDGALSRSLLTALRPLPTTDHPQLTTRHEMSSGKTHDAIRKLLRDFESGAADLESTLAAMASRGELRTAATDDAQVDWDRLQRCGYPEVVYAAGKSGASMIRIFERQQEIGQASLATRVSIEQAEALLQRFPDAVHNEIARTVRLSHATQHSAGTVAVITAGTSDRPVAEEALETLRWMNCACELIYDVGVAGPHRLVEQRPRFANADAVVVVAGMEGALPSVVGGWVSCPVIGVPTSVGYGAAFGGVAALLSMLNSCASNVTVVNIDAGFKAGFVAGLIAQRAAGE